MSWDREPLWAKATLFFERAFAESRSDPMFGFWAALGLELLARSAVASVSPVLLAEPDKSQSNVLHALGRIPLKEPRSIGTQEVLNLCARLFGDKFSTDDKTNCSAIINRRNEEVHSAAAAFAAYPSRLWLNGFYQACDTLSKVQGETLENLFGPTEAENAREHLQDHEKAIESQVLEAIGRKKSEFQALSDEMKAAAVAFAEAQFPSASFRHFHKETCPACGCPGLIKGKVFGSPDISTSDEEIIIRRPVSPREFSCVACKLELNGLPALKAAKLGGRYTRTTYMSPAEYYGLSENENQADEDEVNLAEYDNE